MQHGPVKGRVAALMVALPMLGATAAQAGVAVVAVHTHQGMCEASGAVAVPEGSFADRFVVANDEDNALRLYAANRDGGPLALANGSGDLNRYFGADPDDEDDKADLEGATWLDGKAYWIGSHSRSGGKGKLRPQRWRLFAMTITPGDAPEIAPVGGPNGELLKAITDPALTAAIRLDDDLTKEERQALIPEAGGLNIEGLTASADGTALLVGLRNPLTADGEAYLLRIDNPAALADPAARPRLAATQTLALDGRGIRSIEVVPGGGSYFIVAGPAHSSGSFDLYTWSGGSGDKPQPVAGFAAALAAIEPAVSPEALIVAPDGKRLQLLSDDGDICPEPKAFRSVILQLD